MKKKVDRVEVAFVDREVDSVDEVEAGEDLDNAAEMTGTRGVTVVAAGHAIVTVEGEADLVTATTEGVRVDEIREAEAEVETETETEIDVAAIVIGLARDTAVGEATMMSRLTETMTVKVPDTAAEVRTVDMIHIGADMMITDNLL